MNKKIGFIGCGNMGKAMLGSIVKSDNIILENIMVSTKSKTSAQSISLEFGVKASTNNIEVAKQFADNHCIIKCVLLSIHISAKNT